VLQSVRLAEFTRPRLLSQPEQNHHVTHIEMPDSNIRQNAPIFIRNHYGLLLGLITILGFGIATFLYGLEQRQHNLAQINEIVETQSVKARLLTTMRSAARERSLCLFNMVSLEDPFERDIWFLEFNKYGSRFAEARLQLMQMKKSPQEEQILEAQGKLSTVAIPIQRRVVDLAQSNEIVAARKLLIEEAIPKQNDVFTEISKYQHLLSDTINAMVTAMNAEQKTVNKVILSLGTGSILIGIIIAIYILRKINSDATQLYLEKEIAEVTLSSIGDAVITTDADLNITFMNPEAERMTGWSLHDTKNKPLSNILTIVDNKKDKPIQSPIAQAIEDNKRINSSLTTILIDRSRNRHAIEYTASTISDQYGSIHGGVLIFRDVTENRALADQLSHQASHDALTGLVNRREFEVRLNQAINNAHAERTQYALLYLDLDQFKIINDMGGHIAGDELLKQLANMMRKMLRESDSLARLGGDEFGILLDGCPVSKARDIAEDVRNAIEKFQFFWEGKVYNVGVSIGIYMVNEDAASTADVMSAVDTACYTAKDLGRNRIEIYQPGNNELIKRRNEMYWSQRINAAIKDNKLRLYGQEIRPVNGSAVDKRYIEVLLRLEDTGNQMILPTIFMPAAERFSLTNALDKWVINNVLHTIAGMNIDHGKDTNWQFGINLSAQSINTHEMVGFIISAFDKTGINPGMIRFEVTESMAISNLATARRFITLLKGLGCQFALDDFGKGLSSFTYLKHIPVDAIKIDGNFVKDIVDDKMSSAFIDAINQIAHVMEIETIAEYVENETIYNAILKTRVDYVQGHYVAQPKPIQEFM